MPKTSSSSSSTSSRMGSLDDEDESVRIAVRALGDMKNGTRTSSSANTSATHASSTSTTPTSPPMSPIPDMTSPDFVSRVSNLPLVGSALRAYEQGKASSRVVKYGAEMMESSVKTISRPVFDRLPVDVNQLDEFACRQLDRLEKYRRPSSADSQKMQVDEQPRSQGHDAIKSDSRPQSPSHHEESESPGNSQFDEPTSRRASQTIENRTPTPQSQDHESTIDQDRNQQEVVRRSRWQAVLLEAGGIGAAVSEESMRRLKYCLQWLQYATTHIDAQILILRDFIASLQTSASGSSSADAFVSPTHMRTLNDVRKDVVHTIRQVVDVVSKYAGGALPEPARARVRGFILHLPQRWASASASANHGIPEGTPGANSAAGATAGGTGSTRRARASRHKERNAGGPDRSLTSTPASSRAPSPLTSQRASGRPTTGAATRAAQHILTLATESLDMMRGVTGVVKDSLDRADAWVERLRVIGVQRQQQQDELHEPSFDPTTSPFTQHRQPLPGLSSTPSTPAQADTPFSIPSTPAAHPTSEDGLGMGVRLGEMSARTSLSELCLDSDGVSTPSGIYDTAMPRTAGTFSVAPLTSLHEEDEERGQPIWEKRSRSRAAKGAMT
ncbi:transcription factor Opi1-domain-containing protein [Phlebopus sp. FC_14]|nr:transcription factor Opi1-domain-containing protein [Phlebopus sp. FC_14]